MILTSQEINFLRLLAKVEELAENQDFNNNWRFEKVIYLNELFKIKKNYK